MREKLELASRHMPPIASRDGRGPSCYNGSDESGGGEAESEV